jgi:ribosome-associated protein YbcJ (S4-like RNA binding protein)
VLLLFYICIVLLFSICIILLRHLRHIRHLCDLRHLLNFVIIIIIIIIIILFILIIIIILPVLPVLPSTAFLRHLLRLDQFLKFVKAATNGGHAGALCLASNVYVNGSPELRRGRKLFPGDEVRRRRSLSLSLQLWAALHAPTFSLSLPASSFVRVAVVAVDLDGN